MCIHTSLGYMQWPISARDVLVVLACQNDKPDDDWEEAVAKFGVVLPVKASCAAKEHSSEKDQENSREDHLSDDTSSSDVEAIAEAEGTHAMWTGNATHEALPASAAEELGVSEVSFAPFAVRESSL
jgi:hypothetical protein